MAVHEISTEKPKPEPASRAIATAKGARTVPTVQTGRIGRTALAETPLTGARAPPVEGPRPREVAREVRACVPTGARAPRTVVVMTEVPPGGRRARTVTGPPLPRRRDPSGCAPAGAIVRRPCATYQTKRVRWEN